MVRELFKITELVVNNSECVVLKVKDGHEMDLISIGCFNGDESMFRLTKGEDTTCTIFRKNGSKISWHWGTHGYTLVSNQIWKSGMLLQDCLRRCYHICLNA